MGTPGDRVNPLVGSSAWTHFWANPLLARDVARWRRWARPAAALALLATMGVCAYSLATSALVSRGNPEEFGPGLLLYFVTIPLTAVAGLLWFAMSLVLPAVAASSINRERTSGMWDLLRVTLLTGRQIADGHFVRALLRFPVWLLAVPVFPLSVVSSAYLFNPFFLDRTRAIEGTPGMLVLLALWAVAETIFPVAQLATSVEIGVAAGTATSTQAGAIGATFGGLVLLQWLIPGICGALLSVTFLLSQVGRYDTFEVTPDYMVMTVIGPALISRTLILTYELALFFIARHFASGRIEYAGEA